jgi:hypothetical protein
MSGIRYWSDSAIRVKPSIDEPSNQVPWATDSSSRWIGIVTALTWPMISVNWSWTKRMPFAFAASILALDSGLLATWSMPPGVVGTQGYARPPKRPGALACSGRECRYSSL